ncbi:MAG TPA: dehydratase, partial [Gemmataceae bacterium]|nr:dehydratase [Gemmataceae bacterium]
DWEFKEPVFAGDTLRGRAKVLEKEVRGRGRRGVLTWQRQIVNQDDKLVQQGVILTLVEGRGGRGGGETAEEAPSGAGGGAAPG